VEWERASEHAGQFHADDTPQLVREREKCRAKDVCPLKMYVCERAFASKRIDCRVSSM